MKSYKNKNISWSQIYTLDAGGKASKQNHYCTAIYTAHTVNALLLMAGMLPSCSTIKYYRSHS